MLRAALDELLKGYTYAKDAQRDLWDFAVEIEQLSSLGLTPNDFRWLVRQP